MNAFCLNVGCTKLIHFLVNKFSSLFTQFTNLFSYLIQFYKVEIKFVKFLKFLKF